MIRDEETEDLFKDETNADAEDQLPADDKQTENEKEADQDDAAENEDRTEAQSQDGDTGSDESEAEVKPPKKKKSAQDRINELTWQNRSLQRAAAKQAIRQDSEIQELRDRIESLQKNQSAVAEREDEKSLDTLRGRLKTALENGDSDSVSTLTQKIADAQVRSQIRKTVPQNRDFEEETPEAYEQRYTNEVRQIATTWVNQNADWYGRPGFERETQIAYEIDNNLGRQYPNTQHSEQYWDELDRRIASDPRMARVFGGEPDEAPRQQQTSNPSQKRASPVAGGGRGNKSGTRRMAITEADKAMMKELGLTSEEGQKLYFKEKAALNKPRT